MSGLPGLESCVGVELLPSLHGTCSSTTRNTVFAPSVTFLSCIHPGLAEQGLKRYKEKEEVKLTNPRIHVIEC